MTERLMNTTRLLLGFVLVIGAMTFPHTSFAEEGTTDVNTGIEPGDGCAAVSGFVCSALAAPMGGEVAVTFITNSFGNDIVRFSGRVDQVGPFFPSGPNDCFIESTQDLSDFIPDKKTFDKLGADNLRGFCLDNIVIEGSCAFSTLSFAEVVEAKEVIEGENIREFDVLMLPINCTSPPPP